MSITALVIAGPSKGSARSAPARLRLRPADRLIFVWLYRLCPSVRQAAVVFKPEKLVRWHRSGFCLYWRWKSRRPATAVAVVPAVKGRPRNAKFRQGVAYRQWGLLDQPDDLQFLNGRVSHPPSSPAPIALFFSRRFSSVSSATTSFSALASRRSALTSSEVAARAVSPARRFLPASRNSFDQR